VSRVCKSSTRETRRITFICRLGKRSASVDPGRRAKEIPRSHSAAVCTYCRSLSSCRQRGPALVRSACRQQMHDGDQPEPQTKPAESTRTNRLQLSGRICGSSAIHCIENYRPLRASASVCSLSGNRGGVRVRVIWKFMRNPHGKEITLTTARELCLLTGVPGEGVFCHHPTDHPGVGDGVAWHASPATRWIAAQRSAPRDSRRCNA